MSRRYWKTAVALSVGLLIILPPHFYSDPTLNLTTSPYSDMTDWPDFSKPVDPALESKITELLSTMTLRQKVAQMTQAEIQHATPEQAGNYNLGSVLNGGGSWPTRSPFHSLNDWVGLADQYWQASTNSDTRIPVLWGTDAVHGHNNVFGATLFPHNIALGATGNPELVERIAAATAAQVRATGLDWTFAPTLAVADNPAWGRSYESFSQDSDAVYQLSRAAVRGYQDNASGFGILATAKHFIGDGATRNGVDQGDAWVTEGVLRDRHAQGYFGALEEDVQVVMASFSSWWTKRLHGHHYLLTEVLKNKMGFDGFVLSDWNGITDVYRCLPTYCPEAINAGIDMVMVPSGWKGFIDNTVTAVDNGEIPMSRIDDAVSRILRVKLRAGLFEQPAPSQRQGAGDTNLLNSAELNQLARQAVQQSVVLLKNNNRTLPLKEDGKYLVLGRADHIATHAGGWSLNWQGGSYDNNYFGDAATILDGIEQIAGKNNVTTRMPKADDSHDLAAAIVVLSERSYAEGAGDMVSWQSSAAQTQRGFMGIDQLRVVTERFPELPIIAVYIGGRPLWMNPQINAADAFVVGWLPGTQGAGIADALFGKSPITGRLPFNWPEDDCEGVPLNGRRAAFEVGFGLTLDDDIDTEPLPEKPALTVGTNGLAPDCVWQRQLLTPFR